MNNKEKIVNIVSVTDCWITAKKIWEQMWEVNKTTIYRNLDKLVDLWEFIEDFSNSWEKIYSIKKNHHHHFICDNCSETINIWCILNEEIKKYEKQFNFKINNHSFLLSWLCEKCL